jgi:type IV pilus assembly protein PilA
MRIRANEGFTLIELLIVIAIIGILAAVLIPNLLTARQRAFDTAAQTCLKEISTAEELRASQQPFTYSGGSFATNTILACSNVTVVSIATTEGGTATAGVSNFGYSGVHLQGSTTYFIRNGGGIRTTTPF